MRIQNSEVNIDSISSNFNLDSLIRASALISRQAKKSEDDFVQTVIVVAGLIIIVLTILYLLLGPSNSWSRGKFPMQLKYNEKNLFEAYLSLGVLLFKKDEGDLKEKIEYLYKFLEGNFKGLKNNNYEHILNAIKLEVTEESVLEWLKAKMPQNHRIQIIDFLVNFILINDQITVGEQKMLYRISEFLLIPTSEVNTILSIRLKKIQDKNKAETKTENVTFKSISFKETYLKFFNLEKDCSFSDVKKAYRILAKKFHPDLFMNMGETDKMIAHERFTEINIAYEFLEKAMS